MRRNGAASSDEATHHHHLLPPRRHADAGACRWKTPSISTEPYIITPDLRLDAPAPISPGGPPCIIGYEGVKEGRVPHYLPGKNPFVNEMDNIYHIPPEASLGGAETMYPEFRDKIKDKFTIPPHVYAELRNARASASSSASGEEIRGFWRAICRLRTDQDS